MAGGAPALQFCALPRRFRAGFVLAKGMNNKKDNGDADTRVGHVECRPGMQKFWHVRTEIKQKKVDDVPVKQSVGQVSQNTRKQ